MKTTPQTLSIISLYHIFAQISIVFYNFNIKTIHCQCFFYQIRWKITLKSLAFSYLKSNYIHQKNPLCFIKKRAFILLLISFTLYSYIVRTVGELIIYSVGFMNFRLVLVKCLICPFLTPSSVIVACWILFKEITSKHPNIESIIVNRKINIDGFDAEKIKAFGQALLNQGNRLQVTMNPAK